MEMKVYVPGDSNDGRDRFDRKIFYLKDICRSELVSFAIIDLLLIVVDENPKQITLQLSKQLRPRHISIITYLYECLKEYELG